MTKISIFDDWKDYKETKKTNPGDITPVYIILHKSKIFHYEIILGDNWIASSIQKELAIKIARIIMRDLKKGAKNG